MKMTLDVRLRSIVVRTLVVVAVSVLGAASICRADDAAAMEALKAAVEKAKPLNVEKVCTPISSNRGGHIRMIPNPDGKTYDLLMRYYETYMGPYANVVIDLATGEIKYHAVPEGLYKRRGLVAPDGKYYEHLSLEGEIRLEVYDPATNEFSLHDAKPPVGGEKTPLTVGTDGMIYGAGSYGGKACAYQLDTKTGKLTNYGTMGPSHAPNPCWGYSVAADDRYVYVASGKIPWYIVAYDRETKTSAVILTHEVPKGHIGVKQKRYGCEATLSKRGQHFRDFKRYWLYKGKAILKKERFEAPPWEKPENPEPWVRTPQPLYTWKTVANPDGVVSLWYRPKGAYMKAKRAGDASLGMWNMVRFKVPTFPAPVFQVSSMSDGRIIGSAGRYLGLFMYDPAKDESRHLGKFTLSHYATAIIGNKAYLSGYPKSLLFEYDSEKEWTIGVSDKPWEQPLPPKHARSNPRELTLLDETGSGCHVMRSAAAGADGKAYFGGRWLREGEGGGLGWWDPSEKDPEKASGGIWKPFSNQQIMYMTTTKGSRYVVISTLAVRDAVLKKPTPKQGSIFVFDTQQGKLVREITPVANAEFAGVIAGVDGSHVMGITYDPSDRARDVKPEEVVPTVITGREKAYGILDRNSILYKINVETGEIVFKKRIPYAVGFRTNENNRNNAGFDFRLGPDGKVWTYTGARFVPVNPESVWHYSYINCTLIRIDPKDGAVEVVGKLPHGGKMAFSGKDLYLSGGDRYLTDNRHLRRLKNIVPSATK